MRQVLLQPLDPESAAQRLAECQSAASEPWLVDYVLQLLLRLEALGLVERVEA